MRFSKTFLFIKRNPVATLCISYSFSETFLMEPDTAKSTGSNGRPSLGLSLMYFLG